MAISQKLKKRLLIIVPIVFIVLFIAYKESGLRFTVAALRCGHDPIVTAQAFGSKTYYVPGNIMYKYYSHDNWVGYTCTEAKARADGFNEAP